VSLFGFGSDSHLPYSGKNLASDSSVIRLTRERKELGLPLSQHKAGARHESGCLLFAYLGILGPSTLQRFSCCRGIGLIPVDRHVGILEKSYTHAQDAPEAGQEQADEF